MEGADMKRPLPARKLSDAEARYWAVRGVVYDPKIGQVLTYAGHRLAGVFVLLSGGIRFRQEGGGRRRRVGDLVGPAAVGEEALGSDAPLPLTVEAGSGARVAFVPAARWRAERGEGGFSHGPSIHSHL